MTDEQLRAVANECAMELLRMNATDLQMTPATPERLDGQTETKADAALAAAEGAERG